MLLRMGSAYESLVQNATIFTHILVSTNFEENKKEMETVLHRLHK